VLVVLYFADFISTALWGSNVTYDLASQYVGKGIFQKELQLLPAKVYLGLAGGVIAIFSAYIGVSRPLVRSLEALFISRGELRCVRDGRRKPRTVIALILCMSLIVCVGLQSTSVGSPYRDRLLAHEPILGFFGEGAGINVLINRETRIRLEGEDERVRASYPSSQSFEKKNVIMIVVDSLRADHMQVYGYERNTTPFLNDLMKAGRLKKVETALSACADTQCGVMSTLTSKLPAKQTLKSFKLSDVLHDQGYDLFFVLAGNHNWYDLKNSYGNDLTYYFDGTSSTRYDWNDDRVISEGLERLHNSTGVPSFFYFHLMSTHSTGIRQGQYGEYQPAKNWLDKESTASSASNFYDNGVVQADATIKGIFELLKQKGYLDNSIVVITSDHGEGLGERGQGSYGHSMYLYQECIRIPLLIYEDTPVDYQNLRYATQLDVGPTILSRLGLKIPSSWEGQSLLKSDAGGYSFHQTLHGYPPSYAVVLRKGNAMYKYLRHSGSGEEIYELVSDPHEKHNLIENTDSALIELMRAKLAESLSAE